MADTYSTNRNYRLQTTGGNINTWGIYLNTVLTQIDANISAVLALNVGGSSNVTLTSTQAQNLIHDLTGVLTGNINYTFPDQGGFWIIRNNTTGSFTLTAKVSGGSNGLVIPQGGIGFPVFIDTTVPAIYPLYTNNQFVGGTSAGTATVQTLTTANTNFALTRGNVVSFTSGFASGAGMTLAVDGTTAKTVQINGSAVAAGNFASGSALLAYYDGTNFQLIGGTSANLSAYALLASPTFTGTPAAPTAAPGTNTTQIATTAFTTAAITAATAVPVLTAYTNSLGADVNLNNTGNYFDGPVTPQGTTGTWFASGTVTLQDTGAAVNYNVKLWDGTTVISSAKVNTDAASRIVTVALSGYIASPAAGIRIAVQDLGATTGKILFNASGNSKDSTLTVIRIA